MKQKLMDLTLNRTIVGIKGWKNEDALLPILTSFKTIKDAEEICLQIHDDVAKHEESRRHLGQVINALMGKMVLIVWDVILKHRATGDLKLKEAQLKEEEKRNKSSMVVRILKREIKNIKASATNNEVKEYTNALNEYHDAFKLIFSQIDDIKYQVYSRRNDDGTYDRIETTKEAFVQMELNAKKFAKQQTAIAKETAKRFAA